MSLIQASRLTGIAASTISKIENGDMSPTYDKLMQLSQGLGVDISELFEATPEATASTPLTRRSINFKQSGERLETDHYEYRFLSNDLAKKKMIPMVGFVKARTIEEFGPFVRHPGEEFLYVLSGEIEIHTEHYTPVTLSQGESIYLDSSMGHAYLTAGDEPAQLLVVCTGPDKRHLEAAIMNPANAAG